MPGAFEEEQKDKRELKAEGMAEEQAEAQEGEKEVGGLSLCSLGPSTGRA